MSLDTDRIQAITFDSYSTLVDPRSAGRVLDPHVEEPEEFAVRWHSLAAQYATVTNDLESYRTYHELHRDALEYLLRERGVDTSTLDLDALTDVYHDLDPFEDVRRGFERLSDAGLDAVILSNGEPALLDSLLDCIDCRDLVAMTISADEIRTYKPAAELYEYAARQLDVPIEDVVHVGAGWSDVMGCTNAGMQGIWLNRRGTPWPTFDGNPDLVTESMDEVVDAVLGED